MKHIEFLVEELSAEAALANLLPKILGDRATFSIHVHGGKTGLLDKLPGRLRGYKAWLPENYRIVVLIDEDRADCKRLKADLEQVARNAGFVTKTTAGIRANFQILNRVAVEELEAWFFGDTEALALAYPGVPVGLERKARFRDPDAIGGGTWEALERVLQRAGFHRAGLAKIAAARAISAHMEPDRNRSRSFQTFRSGLLAAIA
jgi:hypothetical protein